ncbi:hypothetical protein HU200_036159 [Digitaria exilis]|uniref:BHLH domain-containing protein n=1 Tax=Digitaria exilis TaxID=1010633 RepID=A0A835BGM0_9POAL|nr:hypothetical protein HU200_036159 [Digitaria exilis]CAB3484287.1 unnamed protein product [Digitaria exilis]
MDMDHQLHQLLQFSPEDHFMASPAFFAVDGHHPAHFQAAGFVEPVSVGIEDGAWVADLMQLGDKLFGGGHGDVIPVPVPDAVGMGDRQELWLYEDDGGSPDDPPPRSASMDGEGGSPPASGEQLGGAGELASDEPNGGEDDASPETTTTTARKRRDRSKTIVSERKRRVRMKEKLYELRSIVPNITKMDKASIIADAVVYVKNLQAHAINLKAEVAALEARPTRSPSGAPSLATEAGRRRGPGGGSGDGYGGEGRRGGGGHGARLTRVEATQVGEGRFFVTVECERRDGVAAPLCAAVESLACFRVESSSIVRSGTDRVVSTLTLKVCQQVGDQAVIGEASVKLWIMAALLKEGFRPETAVGIL